MCGMTGLRGWLHSPLQRFDGVVRRPSFLPSPILLLLDLFPHYLLLLLLLLLLMGITLFPFTRISGALSCLGLGVFVHGRVPDGRLNDRGGAKQLAVPHGCQAVCKRRAHSTLHTGGGCTNTRGGDGGSTSISMQDIERAVWRQYMKEILCLSLLTVQRGEPSMAFWGFA